MQLSKQQEQASKSLEGSTLVIAVPGAGKTTILLERMKNLIEKGIDPKKILTISFSRSAANELKERFIKNYKSKDIPNFQTIHAFAFMILRDYGRKHNIDFKLIEGNPNISKYRLLIDIYKKYNKDYISEERLDRLIGDIGYIKNMMIKAQDFDSDIEHFDQIYKDYEDFKANYNYIDFDDMLTLGYQALKEDKKLFKSYKDAYDYVQVDEGQDTSKVQMEIIKLLTMEKDNLFIVADDDQSIYSFRGADPRGLFKLKNSYDNLKTIHMDINYRSSKNIVLASSQFIGANEERFEKNLRASKDYKEPVNIVKLSSSLDQYDYIMDQIDLNHLDDYAILYRNNVSAMGLIEYMELLNIPFKIRDSSKIDFYNNRIVDDILNILDFGHSPSSLQLLEKIFYKVEGYISRKQINYLKSMKKSSNLLADISKIPNNPAYSEESMARLMDKFERLNQMDFHNKISYISYDMGYKDYLTRSAKSMGLGVWTQLLTLDTLIQISKNVQKQEEFIGRLKFLNQLVKDGRKSKSGLNLSTVHSAKGLEYKKVFIIDVYDGVFPNRIDEDSDIDLEEERRLFYVGMTRAMDELNILYPAYVANEDVEMSIFIEELAFLNKLI